VPSPKQEAELLIDGLRPLAEQLLCDRGAFSPYGGLLRVDGSIVHVSEASATMATLRRQLRARVESGEARAAAIILDASVTPPGAGYESRAIRVRVQHRDSYCAEMFFPYRLHDGQLAFGQVFAHQCATHIFG